MEQVPRTTVTIRKGEAWGTVGPLPAGAVIVRSDVELQRLVHSARSAGEPLPPVALLGGSLMRAVGGSGDERRLGGEVAVVPVDVVQVQLDASTTWAAAHVIARRSWWHGPILAAMNAEFVGAWDVTPRGHPNDGRVDLLEVSAAMSVRDRVRARRRLAAGTHLPHPAVTVRQTSSAERTFERAMRVRVDGVPMGTTRTLRLVVEPDALVVCV
jgi:YegS C-terminal NAD kinase beta sandwich-like domain